MLLKNSSFLVLLLWSASLTAQVNLTQSNLPILLIDTEGNSIPDEPKRMARMQIIANGQGKTNHIEDAPNDYDGWIGIELRGQTSLSLFPKKPFAIETREETGENKNVSLLGMPKENDWVLHNPYSDKTLLRNAITYSLAGKIMDYAPRVRMVELVINQQYQGVYLLTEKIKRDKNRVNISKLTPESEDITGGYILKFDKGDASEIGFTSRFRPSPNLTQPTNFLWHYPKADEITTEQANYIESWINDFENVLQLGNYTDPVDGYRKYIEVESFINFLFINEITRNVDGYRLSSFMYKDSDAIDGRLKMGPVWDFNLALGNADYCEGGDFQGWGYNFNAYCPNDNWVIHFWWKKLLQDDAFRQEVQDRWKLLRANELSDERIFGTIDSLTNLMTINGAANRNFQRWPILGQYVWPNNNVSNTYQEEIAYVRDWTVKRLAWLDSQFNDYVNNPAFEGSNSSGTIKVYPNPTKEKAVRFEYTLNANRVTQVVIYNSMGQFVARLGVQETGINNQYELNWNRIPSTGVYFYNVVSQNAVEFMGKIVVLE